MCLPPPLVCEPLLLQSLELPPLAAGLRRQLKPIEEISHSRCQYVPFVAAVPGTTEANVQLSGQPT